MALAPRKETKVKEQINAKGRNINCGCNMVAMTWADEAKHTQDALANTPSSHTARHALTGRTSASP